jgi:hypothetical protein
MPPSIAAFVPQALLAKATVHMNLASVRLERIGLSQIASHAGYVQLVLFLHIKGLLIYHNAFLVPQEGFVEHKV